MACLLLHVCNGRTCGHYGRATDWLGVDSFKRSKNNTKRFKTCARKARHNAITNTIWNPITNPILNPIWNPITNPIWNPITHPIWNPITNPIWNPITNRSNSDKRKVERRNEMESFERAEGRTDIMSNEERCTIAEQICTDRAFFDDGSDSRLHGKSLDDLLTEHGMCVYFGETGRQLYEEGYRWLSERGSMFSNKNRPVLRWNNGDVITQSEAIESLGFESVFLWQNASKLNTTFVEDKLQAQYHGLGLPRRLYRQVGMGSNGAADLPCDGYVHKVFMTYSFDVLSHIARGNIKIML